MIMNFSIQSLNSRYGCVRENIGVKASPFPAEPKHWLLDCTSDRFFVFPYKVLLYNSVQHNILLKPNSFTINQLIYKG